MADSDRDQVWRIVLDACRTIPEELHHTFLAHVLASILGLDMRELLGWYGVDLHESPARGPSVAAVVAQPPVAEIDKTPTLNRAQRRAGVRWLLRSITPWPARFRSAQDSQ
jgi:hypothetical protein